MLSFTFRVNQKISTQGFVIRLDDPGGNKRTGSYQDSDQYQFKSFCFFHGFNF
jgi:hypothetical protein